jgi:O-acetyl-ADP-ribose deacetylase (regulator of RNase III)
MTGGHDLTAGHVIHTVGPVWNGGGAGEDDLLRGCYEGSMALAAEAGLRTIAFPAVSTGVYRFPVPRAARIAVAAVAESLIPEFESVIFCCFGAEVTQAYNEALAGYR